MFSFIKGLFTHGDDLDARRVKAVAQDKAVREAMTQRDYDKNVQASMHNSDPITKY